MEWDMLSDNVDTFYNLKLFCFRACWISRLKYLWWDWLVLALIITQLHTASFHTIVYFVEVHFEQQREFMLTHSPYARKSCNIWALKSDTSKQNNNKTTTRKSYFSESTKCHCHIDHFFRGRGFKEIVKYNFHVKQNICSIWNLVELIGTSFY